MSALNSMSVLYSGATALPFSIPKPRLSRHFTISSSEISVPRRPFIHCGSKSADLFLGVLLLQSITVPTTSPAPSISTSSKALFIAGSVFSGFIPFSYLEEASVRIPSFLAVFLTESFAKFADSKTTVVVSSMIPLYSPPITPATATGFSASAITSISSVSSLSIPSRVIIFSPFTAFLTFMALPFT